MKKLDWYFGLIAVLFFFVISQAFGLLFLYGYKVVWDPSFNMYSLDALFTKPAIVMSGLGMFVGLTLAPIIVLALKNVNIKESFNFAKPTSKTVLYTLFGMLSVSTIIQYFVDTFVAIFPRLNFGLMLQFNFHEKIAEAIHTDNFLVMLIFITAVGVLPGFGEELLFRGFVQRVFAKRFKIFTAITISGLLFALPHSLQQYSQSIAAFFVSFFLGYIFYKSDKLWVPILAHIFNNSFFVLLLFFFPEYKSMMSGNSSIIPVIISFPVAYICLKYFINMKKL